jgi:hypothetical protein
MDDESIFVATEPPVTDTEDSDGPLEDVLMSSLRDELLSKFDPLTPRISELERTFSRTLAQLKRSRSQSTGDFTGAMESVQRNLRAVHERSIQLVRRVQALTMNTQVASTLSAPRLIRPLSDSYSDFRADFDGALRNITLLSGNLTNKTDGIRTRLVPLGALPGLLGAASSEIEAAFVRCAENSRAIESLRGKATETITSVSSSIKQSIEAKAQEAEASLRELTELADKGISQSDALALRIQGERESLRRSLASLSEEIERGTAKRIARLNVGIDTAIGRSGQTVTSLQDRISDLVEQLANEQMGERDPDYIDQLEMIEQEADLQRVLLRLADLERRVRQAEVGEGDGDVEVFTQIVEGVEKTIYCMPDGAFHY